MQITVIKFYPEEFLTKIDAEKYSAKGLVRLVLRFQGLEIDIKNITYRIDHEGKIHSNKKAGIKPKLVPSIVFRDGAIWEEIERVIREELTTWKLPEPGRKKPVQLEFWD